MRGHGTTGGVKPNSPAKVLLIAMVVEEEPRDEREGVQEIVDRDRLAVRQP